MFRFLFLAIVSTAAAFRFPINTDSAQIAGRRTAVAAIGSAFAAAPLAASAAFVNLQSKVAQEEQALKTEQTLIKDIDEKMKKESRKAFADGVCARAFRHRKRSRSAQTCRSLFFLPACVTLPLC